MTRATDTTAPPTPAAGWRRWVARAGATVALAAMACAALLAALALTPAVSVTVLGQELEVGAVPPSMSSGWSGPGQAELFGGGPVETVQTFQGPIRPRITWERFDRDAAASAFIESTDAEGRRVVATDTTAIGEALARGWSRYFLRLLVVSAGFGAVVYLTGIAIVGIVRGPRTMHRPARHRVWPLAATIGLTVGLAAASATLTVASARSQLSGVSSLADLTGSAPLVPVPEAAGPARSDIQVAVIGDSTAAAVGNAAKRDPTDEDIACQRSQDAYAEVLQAATGLRVANLACASASISDGLLSAQSGRRPVTPPAQVGVLKSISSLEAVIVSVGANDIGWADFLKYCYGLSRCDDQVSERLMSSRLDTFQLQYAQLLQQLADLPTRPAVIVTSYYDPFGETFDCAALQDPQAPVPAPPGYGFAPESDDGDPAEKVPTKVEPMRSILTQLNLILEEGAEAFGFTSVAPTFEGHALCSDQPWVQGLSDPNPFHPNAAGELAIAAAQLPKLVALLPS